MAVKSIFILSIYIKVEKIVRGYVNLAEKFTCSNTQAHIHIMDVQIDNVHDNRFACVCMSVGMPWIRGPWRLAQLSLVNTVT